MTTERIDAHVHFWQLERGDYGWLTPKMTAIYRDFTPSDLKPRLDAAKITRVVLVQAAPTVAETAYMLALADRHDFVAAVVGWVDFEAEDAVSTLERLAAHPKLRGVRPMIMDIPDDDWMLRPGFDRVFDAVRDMGLTFDALTLPRHLPNLLTLLKRHPDLPCIVDHCAKPMIRDGAFQPWADAMARIAHETGAWCKLSGLTTEASPGWTAEDLRPYAEHVLDAFGPERVIWASDWPVLTMNGDYEGWFEATDALLSGLSGADRARVMGGNAAAFYGIA